MNANDLKTKVIELKQILSNLQPIFNISEYQREFDEITDMIYDAKKGMDSNEYANAYKKLEEIKTNLEKEYLPFYKIHLLSSHINNKASNMSENNYSEIVTKVQELIKIVNDILNSNDNIDEYKEKVLHNAYLAIYQSLINEAMIEKTNILHICNQSKVNDAIKLGIGQILKEELNKFPPEDVVDVTLDHIDEGLGYNFLSIDTIKKVGFSLLGNKNKEYLLRRKSAIEAALDEKDRIIQERKDLDTKKRDNAIRKRKLINKLLLIRLKMISIFVLCPMLGVYIGGVIGKSSKIYKTSTKTYNKVTNEIISEKEDYLAKKYLYQANIKKYSPWYEDPNGLGYYRNVEEWEYTDNNQSEGINIDEILKSIERKSSNIELKDILYEDDNTTDDTIFVTETIVDDNDIKDNTTLIIVAMIGFGILGAFGPALYLTDFSEYYDADSTMIKRIKEELGKITKWKVIKESYAQIGDKTVKLQEEYDNIVDKYNAKEFDTNVIKGVKKYLHR